MPKITDYYGKDHDRLEEVFATYRRLKRTGFEKAKQAFVEFKFGLQRHILWEEEILFPLFEQKTGTREGGPTAVMRLEHRQIGNALEAIHAKVQQRNPETDSEEQKLLALLADHNLKEERILYPAIDNLLDEEGRESVFRRMADLPPERYERCCQG